MREVQPGEQGRYGRLNDILMEKNEKERKRKMRAYALEDAVAVHMFAQE